MPCEPHPELDTPSDDTIIWRYMSFVKLMDLLERRILWFARVDTFPDPLEGTHTDAEVEYLLALPQHQDPSIGRQYLGITRMYRETMYVNCWRAAPTESMAMWDIYGMGTGVVAIKSTIGKLKQILSPYINKIFIGRVRYVDWSEVAWNLNALAMLTRKDRSYEHEQELRAVIWGLATDSDNPPTVSYSLNDQGSRIFNGPLGLEVPCEPEILVTEIRIGPREQDMFHRILSPIVQRYGLTFPVTASDRLRSRLVSSAK